MLPDVIIESYFHWLDMECHKYIWHMSVSITPQDLEWHGFWSKRKVWALGMCIHWSCISDSCVIIPERTDIFLVSYGTLVCHVLPWKNCCCLGLVLAPFSVDAKYTLLLIISNDICQPSSNSYCYHRECYLMIEGYM